MNEVNSPEELIALARTKGLNPDTVLALCLSCGVTSSSLGLVHWEDCESPEKIAFKPLRPDTAKPRTEDRQ